MNIRLSLLLPPVWTVTSERQQILSPPRLHRELYLPLTAPSGMVGKFQLPVRILVNFPSEMSLWVQAKTSGKTSEPVLGENEFLADWQLSIR